MNKFFANSLDFLSGENSISVSASKSSLFYVSETIGWNYSSSRSGLNEISIILISSFLEELYESFNKNL